MHKDRIFKQIFGVILILLFLLMVASADSLSIPQVIIYLCGICGLWHFLEITDAFNDDEDE